MTEVPPPPNRRIHPFELAVALPTERPAPPERARATGPERATPSPRQPTELSGKPGEAPAVDAVAGSAEPEEPSSEVAPEREDRDLPLTPAREDVADAMSRVHQAVRDCAPGYSGSTVQVRTTFVSSGRVTTAMVDGPLAGTPEGSCVALAVRDARLPEFEQDSFVVAYPFAL